MIKQIKPDSLSHKFLSLIFERNEIRRGINICDVPWRALKQLLLFLVVVGLCTAATGLLLSYLVGVVLMVLSPFFQYNLFWANLSVIGYAGSCLFVVVAGIMAPIAWVVGDIPFKPTWFRESVEEESPPSLLSIWWKSFREKTCVKIVVEEEK